MEGAAMREPLVFGTPKGKGGRNSFRGQDAAAARRDYAALLAAHHRATLPVLGGAWRAGLGKPGRGGRKCG